MTHVFEKLRQRQPQPQAKVLPGDAEGGFREALRRLALQLQHANHAHRTRCKSDAVHSRHGDSRTS